MLVAFSIANFRSCRDRQTISLVASSGNELPENTFGPGDVAGLAGRRLLKSVGIFGGNATGKSNLVRGMSCFFEFISSSATRWAAGIPAPPAPYGLDRVSVNQPISFAASFVLENVLHEYTFSLKGRQIVYEQLTEYPMKVERMLFRRSIGSDGKYVWKFSPTHFHRDKELEGRTRAEALYLSVAAQWNHPKLTAIHAWATRQNYLVFVGDRFRETMRATTTTMYARRSVCRMGG
jgi:uncharacterized protein